MKKLGKKTNKKTKSRTDWDRLKNIRDEDIDTTDIPMLDNSFWNNAILGSPLRKQLISLRLDKDIINWFKKNGPNYQTRINQVLRSYMEWNQYAATSRIAEAREISYLNQKKRKPTKNAKSTRIRS